MKVSKFIKFGGIASILIVGGIFVGCNAQNAPQQPKQQNNGIYENVIAVKNQTAELDTGYKNGEPIYLQEYEITAYCPCAECCGKSDGITASGTHATAGRTIAADTRYFDYGDKLLIGGKEYIVEDCGGAIKGNKIDVFFNSHEEALEFGRQFQDVYVVSE